MISQIKSFPKYYDNAATTPVDSRVLDFMLPYFIEEYGNASSNHIYGKRAKSAIDEARQHVAEIINANSKEIVFTSGATEAINLGIKGFLEANKDKGNHIITVKTEHKAVLNTCEYLVTNGYDVSYLNVDENGLISIDQLLSNITESTALIAVMYVNNEIGVIQDIEKIGKVAKENGISFFCDATQAVGKVRVDVEKDNIDMLCFSGHKLKGPKGIGALYIKQGVKVAPQIHGGGQEGGLRGGTYNTPLIVGFGKACDLCHKELNKNVSNWLNQKKELIKLFDENNWGVENFNRVKKAPHILSITLKNMEADEFLIMHSKEFIASTGSACNSSIIEVSHVLKAINLSNQIIRLSF